MMTDEQVLSFVSNATCVFANGVVRGVQRRLNSADSTSPLEDTRELSGVSLHLSNCHNSGVTLGAWLAATVNEALRLNISPLGEKASWPEPLDITGWLNFLYHDRLMKLRQEATDEAAAAENSPTATFTTIDPGPDGHGRLTVEHTTLDSLLFIFTHRTVEAGELKAIKEFLSTATPGMVRICRFIGGVKVVVVRST